MTNRTKLAQILASSASSKTDKKKAAKELAEVGGKRGKGRAKRRTPEHYEALAEIKKVEAKIRAEAKKDRPCQNTLEKLQWRLTSLRAK